MKLVEFSRGILGMPEGVQGDPVFVNPAYVTSVGPHPSERGMSWINLAGAQCEMVLGKPSAVAERLAGAGVDRLPDIYAFATPERAPFTMKTHRPEPIAEEAPAPVAEMPVTVMPETPSEAIDPDYRQRLRDFHEDRPLKKRRPVSGGWNA